MRVPRGRCCKRRVRRGFSQLTFSPTRSLIARTGFKPFSRRAVVRERQACSGAKMNKADLIDRIAAGSRINKTQAASAIDTMVDSVTGALRKGDRVALVGFGTFSVSQRKARNGRNPQTGAVIKIAARKVAKFTPGAELRKAVNKK
ncbi:MAG TPA: HU family DNA-binding protein [Terriglobales bacterium]|nr:HU family DNA-binding protein [Terriglobales bacterium]